MRSRKNWNGCPSRYEGRSRREGNEIKNNTEEDSRLEPGLSPATPPNEEVMQDLREILRWNGCVVAGAGFEPTTFGL